MRPMTQNSTRASNESVRDAAISQSYRQTEAGLIPEDWDARRLMSVARIPTGQVDPRDEPFSSMILVAPDHVEQRTGRLLEKRTASDQKAISGKYLFAPGDVVYTKIRPLPTQSDSRRLSRSVQCRYVPHSRRGGS